MKTKILLICIVLLSCRDVKRLDMISKKKESFKFINKTSTCYNKNIYYNCFRSRNNKFIIFLLGIVLFSFYYQYFHIYCNTKPNIINYAKFDNTNYTKLDTITNYTNNLKSEIENFNNELFCPIIDLEKNQDEYRLLSDIKYLQFENGECNFNDPNEKFFIMNNMCDSGGIFANLWCLGLYFSDSLLLKRKFIINMKWRYADENSCDSNILNRNALECYFKPISNCRLDYIHIGRRTKSKIIINNQSFKINPRKDVFFINSQNSYQLLEKNDKKIYYVERSYFDAKIISFKDENFYKYKNITLLKYLSIIWSFIMRLKVDIVDEIDNILLNELKNQILLDKFDPAKSLSMPIRWGDKCGNNYNRPKNSLVEIDECFIFEEYESIIKLMQKIIDLEYVVLTSESKEIIDKAKNITNSKVKFIFNNHDLMQGAGIVEHMTLNSNSLKDIFISSLSSLKLQLISKYYTVMHASTWNAGIWAFASSGCNPILDLQRKGKLKINNVSIIKQNIKDKYLINLAVGSNYYNYLNTYNKEKFQKYIILPKELKANLNLDFDFYNKYSVFDNIYIIWDIDSIQPAPFHFSRMPSFINFDELEKVSFFDT